MHYRLYTLYIIDLIYTLNLYSSSNIATIMFFVHNHLHQIISEKCNCIPNMVPSSKVWGLPPLCVSVTLHKSPEEVIVQAEILTSDACQINQNEIVYTIFRVI